ncbi:MAG: AraC family transcriptional regulator [Ruminococcaceae bacterium]|nr:AraC family transcriptional regulator [Oscillospiraceae bacterium]
MSYDTDRYGLKKNPSQSLAVVECGIQICHSGHATPLMTYSKYSVHFILEGKGKYTVEGKTYELCAGQGFMITPNVPISYVADEREPWKYVYASFCGADDDALVHNAGLDEDNVIFDFPLDDAMISDIYAMHAAGKQNQAKGYDVTGYFLLCMSRLVKANHTTLSKKDMADSYVRKAILYIEDHYPFDISVADIAFHVGLDRTYLYRLFIQKEGCSPSKYLQNHRLGRAVEMLENEELSIFDIGMSVGFHDVSHFYKAFTAKYGMPPKKYRERLNKTEK